MSYYQLKNGRVYIYTFRNGKIRTLPRKETSHLDGLSSGAIKDYIEKHIDKKHEKPKRDSGNSHLEELVSQFLKYYQDLKGIQELTVERHRQSLIQLALPYFTSKTKYLREWPLHSTGFLNWMLEKEGLSANGMWRTNNTLHLFWKWLGEEGYIPLNPLVLRNPKLALKKRETPLKQVITPSEMLEFCKQENLTFDIKFMALSGYFFSLRPQETMALKLKHFATGDKAQSLECCRVMKKVGLFHRLAVKVETQRGYGCGDSAPPKSNSKGWVSCFDREASEALVGLLRAKKEEEVGLDSFLLQKNPSNLFFRWRTDLKGTKMEGVTLKDLRRSSLYHLGHNTEIPLIALKNHARHLRAVTTELYTRRPEEDIIEEEDLLSL